MGQPGSFDALDQMTSLGTASGPPLTAGYDPSGLRAWKQSGQTGGGKVYTFYDGGDPLAEATSNGTLVAVNTFAGGLLSRQAGGTGASGTTLYTFDPKGNVAQRVSAGGSVQSTDHYNAYGQLLGSSSGDEFGFGGQAGYRTDPETGLCLLGQRYYDPGAGRFLTRDPAGYAGGMDLYAYTGDDPVNGMDPSGLCDDDDPECVNLGDPNTPGFAQEHANLGDYHQAGLDFSSAIVHTVPGWGTLFNGSDAATGCDMITGRSVSTGGRWMAGAMAIISLIPGGGLASSEGRAATRGILVTHWGTPEEIAALKAGQKVTWPMWVMKGGPSLFKFRLSLTWPTTYNLYPWMRKVGYNYDDHVTLLVPANKVRWPTDLGPLGLLKGLFLGHRKFVP